MFLVAGKTTLWNAALQFALENTESAEALTVPWSPSTLFAYSVFVCVTCIMVELATQRDWGSQLADPNKLKHSECSFNYTIFNYSLNSCKQVSIWKWGWFNSQCKGGGLERCATHPWLRVFWAGPQKRASHTNMFGREGGNQISGMVRQVLLWPHWLLPRQN